ncbi:hypothetical protein [Thiocapsa rosea]|uniref:Lipoprotein n=1 Tax=Thiocapsa rosea TaxID=69360 RepID=A0A495VBQ8_9GAMM|nr:hypothetical protein [Thiocapsa rosea]RKT45855.1 hypothetical protein BDD21_3337 [Thiocapsa rosea]
MAQAHKRTRLQATLAVTGVVMLALSGCGGDLVAPDSLIEKPGVEGFYNQIANACGHHSLGNQPLNYLINISDGDGNDYFLDETSKLYYGRIDRTTYATDINGFFPTGTNTPALNCIYAQLDQAPPP